MKLFRELLSFICALIVAIASLWVLFNTERVAPIISVGELDFWLVFTIWVIFVIAVITLFLFVVNGSTSRGIVRVNEIGKLKINIHALEDIAQAEIKRMSGIKVIKTPITMSDKGVRLEVKIGVLVDENIPDLALVIQRRVKETIEKTTEIPVTEVKVTISDVYMPAKSRVE